MKSGGTILWLLMLSMVPLLLAGCADLPDRNELERIADTTATITTSQTQAATSNDLQSDIISWFIADIDGDETAELLLVTTDNPAAAMSLETGERYGTHIAIYSEYDIHNDTPIPQGEPDEQFDLSALKPLMIQAGDINGDGIVEIAVCVYKTAEFHPAPAKRPFFYDLNQGELESVWLGSRLARPFADYILYDVDDDGIDEIISIEMTQSGNQVLAVYDWKGFGFEVKTVSEEIEGTVVFINNINSKDDAILIEIAGEAYQLQLEEGEVIRWRNDY